MLGFVFSLLVLAFVGTGANAACYVNEEFDVQDDTLWQYRDNGGSITYGSGVLTLGSTGLGFPVLYSKFDQVFPLSGNSVMEVKYKYISGGHMGDGISVGFTGNTGYPFYQFSLWRDVGAYYSYNNFNLLKYNFCNPSVAWSDLDDRQVFGLGYDNEWHTLRIERKNASYLIYIDKSLNPVPLYIATGSQCLPAVIIIGNPLTGGRDDWNSLSIDYLKISTLGETCPSVVVPTFTPTPTATPTPEKKVIIIPGMGASWNTRTMVYNDTVADDQWNMTPFVKNYEGLAKALENNNLVKNVDYYVWNYDWRRPMAEIADKFNNFVNAKVGVNEKLDIVGHSLGGLVGRMWAQNNATDIRLDKVITLGSPHQGVVQAYEMWNGGKITDTTDPAGIALNILLQLQGGAGSSRAKVIRQYSPIVKDILPTFDYQKKNGVLVSILKTGYKNEYLVNMNVGVSVIGNNLIQGVGIGQKTKEFAVMTDRTIYDQVLDLWKDGKVSGYVLGDGDRTVLKKSAKFTGLSFFEVGSNHGDIVDKSINRVLGELGLGVTVAVTTMNNLENKMILFLGSPAKLNVDCGEGIIESEDFVLVDATKLSCRVKVVGTGNGIYHLVLGSTNNDDWSYMESEIVEGGEDEFWIKPGAGKIDLTKSLEYIKKLVKGDLGSLGLLADIPKVDEGDYSGVNKDVFGYRKVYFEDKITIRLLKNLEYLLADKYKGITAMQASSRYKQSLQEKSLADRITRLNSRTNKSPTVFGSASYFKADLLVAEEVVALNARDFGGVMAKAEMVTKYLAEVWPN